MRILSWMQNKIHGKPEKEKKKPSGGFLGSLYHNVPDTCKQEFSDWPNDLLSIGTFGNSSSKGTSQRFTSSESSCSSQTRSSFSVEEANKLQMELIKQLELEPKSGSCEPESEENVNHLLDKFLNCPSSLEIDRRTCDVEEDGDVPPNSRIVPSVEKDIQLDGRSTINQKSFSILIKKLFVCKGGFVSHPSFKDPLPESRMEKLMRAIFQKKMQSHCSVPTSRRYLGKNSANQRDGKSEEKQNSDGRSKWVKTDTEYIVLEI